MHHATRVDLDDMVDGSKRFVESVTETAPKPLGVPLEAPAVPLEAGGFSAPYVIHTRRS